MTPASYEAFGGAAFQALPLLQAPQLIRFTVIAAFFLLFPLQALQPMGNPAPNASPVSCGARSFESWAKSPCAGDKVQWDLTHDPTITPVAMLLWHGRRCTCVDQTSDLIVALPAHVEGTYTNLILLLQPKAKMIFTCTWSKTFKKEF